MYSSYEKDLTNYLKTFNCILRTMISRMTEVVPINSVSHNFILQMIPHHHAAIQMSKNVLQYICHEQVRTIALNIISEQTKSIANMEHVLCRCGCYTNSDSSIMEYQTNFLKIATEMYYKMSHAKTGSLIDYNFITEMIPHHEGAISMSLNTLQYDICPELKPILKAIIVSQRKGVKEMENLLKNSCSCRNNC